MVTSTGLYKRLYGTSLVITPLSVILRNTPLSSMNAPPNNCLSPHENAFLLKSSQPFHKEFLNISITPTNSFLPHAMVFAVIQAKPLPLIKRISRFFTHRTSPAPKYDLSVLEKLPAETIQLIARYLEGDSTASLALCSKRLQRVIGTLSFEALHMPSTMKTRFLAALSRDLPNISFCHHCKKLHPYDGKGPKKYFMERYEHPCAKNDGHALLVHSFGVRFQYAQLAVKNSRLGIRKNIYLDGLSYADGRSSALHYFAVSSRVVVGHLLVKIESRVPLELFPKARQSRKSGAGLAICHHCRCSLDSDVITKIVHNEVGHRTVNGSDGHTGLLACKYCATEYKIACLPIKTKLTPYTKLVSAVAWRDFGPCISPFDPLWQSQLWLSCVSPDFREWPMTWKLGNIQQAFEAKDGEENTVDLEYWWELDNYPNQRFSRARYD